MARRGDLAGAITYLETKSKAVDAGWDTLALAARMRLSRRDYAGAAESAAGAAEICEAQLQNRTAAGQSTAALHGNLAAIRAMQAEALIRSGNDEQAGQVLDALSRPAAKTSASMGSRRVVIRPLTPPRTLSMISDFGGGSEWG